MDSMTARGTHACIDLRAVCAGNVSDRLGITSMQKINTSTANTPKVKLDVLRSHIMKGTRPKYLCLLCAQLDCYSFGIVLWVLLGWELPFRNMAPMQVGAMHGCRRVSWLRRHYFGY